LSEGAAAGRPPSSPPRRLRGMVWIVILAALFFVAVAWVQIRTVLTSQRETRIGDGKNVASYGFDLAGCLVDSALIVASGMPRDTLTPLDYPLLMTAAAVDSLNRAERGKYLVSDDLVIGVVVAGRARAYPVRVLAWHEIANDTLAGRPIAVTWHPLCGSAVVVDRRVGDATLNLGQSGLLWNSNLLLYDRDAPPGRASLWSQLQARAVAGPAAARGDSLAVLPHTLTSWSRWRAEHPGTTVPFPDQALRPSYKREPYGAYTGSDLLRFPVAPLPPRDAHTYKERVVSLYRDGAWQMRFVGDRYAADEPSIVDASGSTTEPTIHAYFFAWYATRSDAACAGATP